MIARAGHGVRPSRVAGADGPLALIRVALLTSLATTMVADAAPPASGPGSTRDLEATRSAATRPAPSGSATVPAADDPPPVTESGVEADGSRIMLRASDGVFEVGQPVRLRLEVDLAPGSEVRFETLGSGSRSALGPFEVRSARLLPADPRRPRLRVQEIEVTTFESGRIELPPLSVRLTSPEGGERSVSVGPLRFDVRSLVGDADPLEALRPVKDPVEIALPRDWRLMAAIAIGALLLLALAWAAWRLLRRPAVVPVISPYDAARAALAKLRSDDLPAAGRVLEFYIRLSDIVRGYVEGRFGIRAPEQTTKEFLAAASHHPSMREEHRILLAGFLRSADRVKFAAERPGASECERAFDAASAFVDETAPDPAAPTPPPVAATGSPAPRMTAAGGVRP